MPGRRGNRSGVRPVLRSTSQARGAPPVSTTSASSRGELPAAAIQRRRVELAPSTAARARRRGPAAGTARAATGGGASARASARSKRSRPAPRANVSERSVDHLAASPELADHRPQEVGLARRATRAAPPARRSIRQRDAGRPAAAMPTSRPAPAGAVARPAAARVSASSTCTRQISSGSAHRRSPTAARRPAAGSTRAGAGVSRFTPRWSGRTTTCRLGSAPSLSVRTPSISFSRRWMILRSTEVIGSSSTGSPV